MPVHRDSTDRHASVDVVRGVAIVAIAIANAPLYLGPAALAFRPPPAGAPLVEVGAHGVLVAVNALQLYLVFALLFGYGLGVQLGRAQHGGVAYVRRRLVVLAVLGAAHTVLLWYGDILLTYALAGAVVVALRDLRRAVRLAVALALFVSVPLVLLLSAASAASDTPIPAELRRVDAQLAAYRSADLGRIMAQRLADARHQAGANLVAVPAIVALMLMGMEGAIGAWPQRLAAWAQQQPIQLLLVLGSGLVLTQGGAAISADVGAVHAARLLGVPPIAVAGLAWLLGREGSGRPIPGQRTLAAVGRLSISTYLTQSLLFTSLAYGYGLGTYGTWSPVGMLLIALAIAATGAGVARAMGTCWSVGPIEWLWRRLAHGLWSMSQPPPAAPARHGHATRERDDHTRTDHAEAS